MGVPELEARDVDRSLVDWLGQFRDAVVRHPVAARAIVRALVAEGRRYAETGEGAEWKARLQANPRVSRAHAVWDTTTMWLLEGAEGEAPPLPSTLLDAVVMTATRPDRDALLRRLFSERS